MPEIKEISRDDEREILEIENIEAKNFSHPWSKETICEMLKYEYNHCFVMCSKDSEEKSDGIYVFGYLIYSIAAGDAELQRIAVSEKCRREGFGEQMMAELFNKLKAEKAERVTLEVRISNNAAIMLYKSFGMKNIFERKNYYRNPEENAFIFQRVFGEEGNK